MTCAISWGRCSLIGLLVVMSVVIVLVPCLLVFRWMEWGRGGVPVHLYLVVCYGMTSFKLLSIHSPSNFL